MKVRKLDTTNRADVARFVDFPFKLYEGSDEWVPSVISSVKASMDRRSFPFYRHSDADFFLVEEGGRALGRVAVLENSRFNKFNDVRFAFLYYFDAVDDLSVSRALFDAAAEWAQERDLDTLYGPKGFLRADSVGVLVEGFEYRAAPGMPYNYPYYGRLFEAYGFEKELNYDSGYVEGPYELPERFYRIADRVRERSGFWVKSFRRKRELRAWLPHIQRVNNEAFTSVWGTYPMDDAETQMIAKQLLTVADPRLIKLVMKEDEVVGFVFVFPDVSRALQATKGRLWPFGWIRLLWAFRHTKRMSVNGLGLLPEYQGLGANAVLYAELVRTLETRDVEFADVAQVAEFNQKSLSEMEALGVTWYKTHRVYKRAL